MNNSTIAWISNWFSNQCDGDWEHENQIKIYTVSNPGWFVEIELSDTDFEDLELEGGSVDNSESDRFFYKVSGGKFTGSGDLSKLEHLLSKFRTVIELETKV